MRCFFFPSFLFLFPSVNCFSTLFFSENYFLLTVNSIQRLRPSRPRQHPVSLAEDSALILGLSLVPQPNLCFCTSLQLVKLPMPGKPRPLSLTGMSEICRGHTGPNPQLSLPPPLPFPWSSYLCLKPQGYPWAEVESSHNHLPKPTVTVNLQKGKSWARPDIKKVSQ